jgi:hypothetical protein
MPVFFVDHHLLRCLGPYLIIIMKVYVCVCVCVCVVLTTAMIWSLFAVKGFWALWDNTESPT